MDKPVKPITPARREANKRNMDKRYYEANRAADVNGFDNWSQMLTFIKNEAKAGRAVVDTTNRMSAGGKK